MEIKHLGKVSALCNKNISANLRDDLVYDRYLKIGTEENFKDEKPYTICKKCLKIVKGFKINYFLL